MEWGTTVFVFQDDGVEIHIPNVPAWVCPRCGEVSFTPEVTDQLIETQKELASTAKRARQRASRPQEYVVRVA
jgi:YgiT-type zinc finger domain-containing protein